MELNLENPIFIVYIDVNGMSTTKAREQFGFIIKIFNKSWYYEF